MEKKQRRIESFMRRKRKVDENINESKCILSPAKQGISYAKKRCISSKGLEKSTSSTNNDFTDAENIDATNFPLSKSQDNKILKKSFHDKSASQGKRIVNTTTNKTENFQSLVDGEFGDRNSQYSKYDGRIKIKKHEPLVLAHETINEEKIDLKESDDEIETAGTNISFSEDLNGSFFDAALEGISPVKKNVQETITSKKLLSCSISCSSSKFSLAKYRFRVLEVIDNDDNKDGLQTKQLILENESTRAKAICYLRRGWLDTDISNNDVINIVVDDDCEVKGEVDIDSNHNLIVVHPDLLISGTTVSNAIGCMRRAILNERFKSTDNNNNGKPVMLIGTIVHTLFQTIAQSTDAVSAEQLLKMAEDSISRLDLLKNILSVGTTEKEVLDGVKEFIPSLISWRREFVRKSPTFGIGQVDVKLPPGYKNRQLGVIENNQRGSQFSANVSLTEVKDIEENIWSPLFGLKGRIDLTGSFLIKRKTSDNKLHSAKMSLPLELKTGRANHSIEHHAQVAIYAMFCEQRKKKTFQTDDCTMPAGLLLYLKTGNMSCIPLKREDRRELIKIRNQIASYLMKSILETECESSRIYRLASLPPTIDDERLCKNCSQLRNCSLMYRTVDRKHSDFVPAPALNKLFESESSHLSEKDIEYFEHWMTCTLLETRKSMKKQINQYYWLKTPQEREESGHCVSDLVLAGLGKSSEDGMTSFQTFKRATTGLNEWTRNFNIFEEGEMVVISGTEHEFVAMASGSIVGITGCFITVSTDRKFGGYPKNMKYTIDKHEWPSINSFKSSFHNLSVLMQSSSSANNLRELIIHHREPNFKTNLQEVIPRSAKDDIAKMLRGLNRTQRQAIKRVLLSQDYTLVVGMPGSGKTTTIVAMVRILVLCGCRVLLTSYTHSAIDNLLIKLVKYKVKFLRLGHKSQVHPSIHPFTEVELTKHCSTPRQLDDVYTETAVVACTCLAVTSHALFTSPGSKKSERCRFDVCIVDEASQISQPTCLAPLLHSLKFVLVGDHRQLPPLVQSRKARTLGADESLFWRLSHHASSLCELTLQYRMNSVIMQVSNYVTYDGRLECATQSVANARLNLPNWSDVSNRIKLLEANEVSSLYGSQLKSFEWLDIALRPDNSVLFLDMSLLERYEEEMENGICNKYEAEIIKILVDHLLQAGCKADDIGIIAPFRKQLKVIEESLNVLSRNAEKIEISTVDKYQGRDKNVIIVSFVRCRNGDLGEKKGELLNDWRRLNVALTRSKHKLLLVGCRKTLVQYEPCRKLLSYVVDNDLLFSL